VFEAALYAGAGLSIKPHLNRNFSICGAGVDVDRTRF